MNPGKLKDKITIRSVSTLVDAEGTVKESYSDSFVRFANVRPARGREAYVNDQNLSEIDYVISLRFDSKTRNITPQQEIDYKGQRLRITSPPINVENMDKEIRLFCTVYGNGY